MEMSLGTLETECGLGLSAATALEGGSELLHEATHSISRSWIELRHMLECKTFNPIYTTFAHDGKSQGQASIHLCAFIVGIHFIFTNSCFVLRLPYLSVYSNLCRRCRWSHLALLHIFCHVSVCNDWQT